jgi:dihydropteroate synthase-like protein
MNEHLLFLTGKLAEKQLRNVLAGMNPDFSYTVHQLGLKVAGLMTTDMVARRLRETFNADRIILPGRCRGDVAALSSQLGIPVERGPEEVKDLPQYFGKAAHRYDLSRYAVKIFAEIVDATALTVEQILERAAYYREQGADVIDLGCLPNTPFPHLEEGVMALKQAGFDVSVDSLDSNDLLKGGKAGADFLLSLHEGTLWIADEVPSTPIIIPQRHQDMASLERAIGLMQAKNRAFFADPILDPIHFGFTESIVRYQTLRQRHPEIDMMLGVGNITELTHADTMGINALLLGICSELNIGAILTTQVSRHACRAVKEADQARRIMLAAKESNTLPKHIDSSLLALHELSPFPYSTEETRELAAQITDPSYRIQVSADGIHIFNRDGLYTSIDPFDFYPKLGVQDDSSHAFYLGVELARAQIAWQLGKRYTQDRPLTWGCAAADISSGIDIHAYKPAD